MTDKMTLNGKPYIYPANDSVIKTILGDVWSFIEFNRQAARWNRMRKDDGLKSPLFSTEDIARLLVNRPDVYQETEAVKE